MNRHDQDDRHNPDCQWFDSATESYFTDAMTPPERARFEAHTSVCAACAAGLAELRAVDPLMKDLLQYRIALAQAAAFRPARPRWGRIAALAGVPACAAALALGIALWPQVPASPPQVVVAPPQPNLPIDKIDASGTTTRNLGKPTKTNPVVSPADDRPNRDALPTEEFAVIDAAGQIRTLADFRGHIFLFGVLSSTQPRTAANLEKLYRTFPELVLVAVSPHRQDPAPPNTTFQTLYNKGSRLLGAKESEFVLVDAAGVVVLRGSLSTTDADPLTKSVRAALGPQKKP